MEEERIRSLVYQAEMLYAKSNVNIKSYLDPVAESKALSAQKAAIEQYNKIRSELDELQRKECIV